MDHSSQPKFSRYLREKLVDKTFITLTLICALGIGLALVAITLTVTWRALPAIQKYGWHFLATNTWNPVLGREEYGILPAISGTLFSSAIALLLAFPLGLGTAIFLSEDFLPLPIRTILIFLVELLAAIPSVVYGLWGFVILIPWLKPLGFWLNVHFGWFPLFASPPSGPGLLPAALVLGIMILPFITAVARESLTALPTDLREAAFALGATRWETIGSILLPAASSGIFGGVILALGRALGETMAVTMLIGNSPRISTSLFAPATSITSLLANQFAEAKDLQVAALMYAALVLLLITLVVNLLAERIIQNLKF